MRAWQRGEKLRLLTRQSERLDALFSSKLESKERELRHFLVNNILNLLYTGTFCEGSSLWGVWYITLLYNAIVIAGRKHAIHASRCLYCGTTIVSSPRFQQFLDSLNTKLVFVIKLWWIFTLLQFRMRDCHKNTHLNADNILVYNQVNASVYAYGPRLVYRREGLLPTPYPNPLHVGNKLAAYTRGLSLSSQSSKSTMDNELSTKEISSYANVLVDSSVNLILTRLLRVQRNFNNLVAANQSKLQSFTFTQNR
ncbi:unnamed protein product [Trichobilharzia regenti]|nr:unnamed protein product [Trichobilharzia regenti]